MLSEPRPWRDGSDVRCITQLEAVLRTYRDKALQGHARAALAFFRVAQRVGAFSRANPNAGLIVLTPPKDPIARAYQDEQDRKRQPTTQTPTAPASAAAAESPSDSMASLTRKVKRAA